MNRWPHRLSFFLFTLAFGVVLALAGPPPIVITVPWLALWGALMLAVALLVGRRGERGTRRIGAGTVVHSDPEMLERFPEVVPLDISYTPARIGPTEKLERTRSC